MGPRSRGPTDVRGAGGDVDPVPQTSRDPAPPFRLRWGRRPASIDARPFGFASNRVMASS